MVLFGAICIALAIMGVSQVDGAICTALTAPTNGVLTCQGGSSTANAANCTFTCNTGYVLYGNRMQNCTTAGTWTGAAGATPTCIDDRTYAYSQGVCELQARPESCSVCNTLLFDSFDFDPVASSRWYTQVYASTQALVQTGTASQTGTTVTGSGTGFQSTYVGATLTFANGITALITAYTSGTSLQVSPSQTVVSQSYTISPGAFQATTVSATTQTVAPYAQGYYSSYLAAQYNNVIFGLGYIPGSGQITGQSLASTGTAFTTGWVGQ